MTSCTDKFNQLLTTYNQTELNTLIWLDENTHAQALRLQALNGMVQVVSNRFDDINELQKQNISAEFSDFELPTTANTFDIIFYRISKERLVSHHCINQSRKVLSKNGKLILIGKKEEGIKTYFDHCRKQLKATGELKKDKNIYWAELSFESNLKATLNDGDYLTLREIANIEINQKFFTIYSKPGVYGWKKIDAGTRFLTETLNQYLNLETLKSACAMDLGCGSGHVSLALHAWGIQNIVATDNNAAALLATAETLSKNNVPAQVLGSNAGNTIGDTFDLIVSNPPFHKGFDTSTCISNSFVSACKRMLNKNGAAFFVTNAFVNIEKPLKEHHLQYEQLANNRQFKITKICHG